MRHEKVETFIKALHLFQELDIEMQIPTILTFVELSESDLNNPPSITDLGTKMGLEANSTAGSRNIMTWSEVNRNKGLGYDMMETKENPEYRVQKKVYLKHKGHVFAQKLREILQEE